MDTGTRNGVGTSGRIQRRTVAHEISRPTSQVDKPEEGLPRNWNWKDTTPVGPGPLQGRRGLDQEREGRDDEGVPPTPGPRRPEGDRRR